jgi:protein involved in polysaccharide export with SLBB domain
VTNAHHWLSRGGLPERLSTSVVALVLVALVGCGAAVPDDYLAFAALPYASDGADRLGPTDRFEIHVFREEDLTGRFVVGTGGGINFPLIGRVDVAGRTCAEVEHEIAVRLGERHLRHPSVNCTLVEVNSRRFSVNGEVRRPSVFPFRDGITVVDAVAMAGGITEAGDGRWVVVMRVLDGRSTEINVPYRAVLSGAAPNLQLWPDDIVTVPAYRLIR